MTARRRRAFARREQPGPLGGDRSGSDARRTTSRGRSGRDADAAEPAYVIEVWASDAIREGRARGGMSLWQALGVDREPSPPSMLDREPEAEP